MNMWAWVKRVWVPLGYSSTPEGIEALKKWAWSRGWPVKEGHKGRAVFSPDPFLFEPSLWERLERLEETGEAVIYVDREMGK